MIVGTDNDPNTPATTKGHYYTIVGYTASGKWLVLDSNSVTKSQTPQDPGETIAALKANSNPGVVVVSK